jgi:PAS domain S-box-containing protein
VGEKLVTSATIDAGHPGPSAEERVTRAEHQLAVAQQITHIGSWEWDVRTNVVSWSDELYRIYGLEPRSCEITFETFLSKLHPDDRARVQREVGVALASGSRFAYPERVFRPDGTIRELDTIGEAAKDESGRVVGLIGTCRDVTEERKRDDALRRTRNLQETENGLLEKIATGAPLVEILTALALVIEEHAPPTIASILLLDEAGTHVKHGAAPHLPDAYNRAIDGVAIGPMAGSCGTAAFTRSAVIVPDVETDPRWADYRDLARAHGLRACWSTPIFATDGHVLGTFALYFREPRLPTEENFALIARATHIAGIAIERRQLEDQLRELSGHVESVREDERTGIAREIHDQLGQALTAFKMDLAWIARRVSAETAVDREALLAKTREMSQMTDEVINQVRRISADLRPGVLDDLGLLAAIEWEGERFEQRTGMTCALRSNLGDARLDRELSTAVFRIFQEALTNVARHAEAKHVDVTLERRGGSLVLEVRDDGKGILPEALHNPRSLGLLGIRERARRLGGAIAIGAGDPSGTTLMLILPLAAAERSP